MQTMKAETGGDAALSEQAMATMQVRIIRSGEREMRSLPTSLPLSPTVQMRGLASAAQSRSELLTHYGSPHGKSFRGVQLQTSGQAAPG